MKLTDVNNTQDLWTFMTTPSQGLIESLKQLGDGDMMILGGSGKMGKELVGLVQNCDIANDITRNIMVASTFSKVEDLNELQALGVTCFQGERIEQDVC